MNNLVAALYDGHRSLEVFPVKASHISDVELKVESVIGAQKHLDCHPAA